MLIHPSGYGIYGYTLHSPRQIKRLEGRLKSSGDGQVTDQRIALELAKDYWRPGKDGTLFPSGVLREANDVVIESTTSKLNKKRSNFQGLEEFLYSVGEEILIHPDKAQRLYDELPNYDVTEKSIDIIKGFFADKTRLTRSGSLPLHVVHVADAGSSNNPYRRWDDETIQICSAMKEHKPYYELVPRGNGGWSHLMFVPKDLTEEVARLHPQPHPFRLYGVLYLPGRCQT